MNANHIWDVTVAGIAAAGSVLANAFGGWDMTLQVLIACMAIDYATGLIVAGVFKRSTKSAGGALESRAGFKGLCKKGAILCIVLVAALLDRALGAPYVRMAVCLFFVANEALSILENVGLMGVKYPPFLKNMLQALLDKSGSGDAAVKK